jgi:23S rRNA (guanosine2251-2'-O)-methyltransferase
MTTKKPAWVIDKERARRDAARETVWLFGLHAVRDALLNPAREKLRLVVTKNALDKLADAVDVAGISGRGAPLVVLLDRVTDPHNVGAVLRSAEVFGARAVVAPLRHSAPETGALAKTASGALERQPYLRITNLADAMRELQEMGYVLLGLAGEAEMTLAEGLAQAGSRPVGLVLGAEGPGLREKTRETCDFLVRIPFAGGFGSLNVSNAAAVSLYATVNR